MFTRKSFERTVSYGLTLTFVISLILCLWVLVTPSFGQSLPPQLEKDINIYIKEAVPNVVEACNQNVNDIFLIQLLQLTIENKFGKKGQEKIVSWIALNWLESYYKDAVIVYPEKRKTYESGAMFCNLAIQDKTEQYTAVSKDPNSKYVLTVMKKIQQATKTAYLKSPTRVGR